MQKRGSSWLSVVLGVLIMTLVLAGAYFFYANRSPAQIDISKMTNEQIEECFGKTEVFNGWELFSIGKIFICPQSYRLNISSGKKAMFAIGIRNRIPDRLTNHTFSYEVVAIDNINCSKTSEELTELIDVGQAESNIAIAPGDIYITRASFYSKVYPSCLVRYRIMVYADGKPYDSPRAIDVKFN